MSELKAHNINDLSLHDIANCEFYLKPEVDKLIAEKDTKIIQLEALIENYNRISGEIIDNANHQKYRRCLAMAEMCGQAYDQWVMKKDQAIGLGKDGIEYFLEARHNVSLYKRWNERWLKIAEKFKEAKCR